MTQSKAPQGANQRTARSRTRAQSDCRQGHREVKQRARNEGFEYMPPISPPKHMRGFLCACRTVVTDPRHLESHLVKCGKAKRDEKLQEFSSALRDARAELNGVGPYQYKTPCRDGKSQSHPKKYQVDRGEFHTTWPKGYDNYSHEAYPDPPEGHKVTKKVPLSAKKQSPTGVAGPGHYKASQPVYDGPRSIQDSRPTRLYPTRPSGASSSSRRYTQGSISGKYSGPSGPPPRYESNPRLRHSDVTGPQTRLGTPAPSYAKTREDCYSYHSSDLPSESHASSSGSSSVKTPSEY